MAFIVGKKLLCKEGRMKNKIIKRIFLISGLILWIIPLILKNLTSKQNTLFLVIGTVFLLISIFMKNVKQAIKTEVKEEVKEESKEILNEAKDI